MIATVFEKLLRFITRFADISARFYYKELIKFGADLAFSQYLAPSLTLRGGLLVNP